MQHDNNRNNDTTDEEISQEELEALIGDDTYKIYTSRPGLILHTQNHSFVAEPPSFVRINPDIDVVDGSPTALPPPTIVYNKTLLDTTQSPHVCHYFNDDKHVYSISHTRKRRKFSNRRHSFPKHQIIRLVPICIRDHTTIERLPLPKIDLTTDNNTDLQRFLCHIPLSLEQQAENPRLRKQKHHKEIMRIILGTTEEEEEDSDQEEDEEDEDDEDFNQEEEDVDDEDFNDYEEEEIKVKEVEDEEDEDDEDFNQEEEDDVDDEDFNDYGEEEEVRIQEVEEEEDVDEDFNQEEEEDVDDEDFNDYEEEEIKVKEVEEKKLKRREVKEYFTYLPNATGIFRFPCLSVRQLQQCEGFKSVRNPMPLKDIVWLTSGRILNEDIYPICKNTGCHFHDHLAQITRNEYLRKQGCIGTVVFVHKGEDYDRLGMRLPCPCDIQCKKYYFHEYREEPITSTDDTQLPFNLSDVVAPIEPHSSRDNKNVAMRFTMEEAQELLKLCRRGFYVERIDYISNTAIRERLRSWNMCMRALAGNIYVQKHQGNLYSYLMIPRQHYLASIATKIKLKDLMWRAHGHGIENGQHVYSTCQDSECIRYEHLVAETLEEYMQRLSCGTILCIKDDELNSVINCKHDKKCRLIRYNLDNGEAEENEDKDE